MITDPKIQRRLLRVAKILSAANRIASELTARDNAGPQLIRDDSDIEAKIDEVGEMLLQEQEEEDSDAEAGLDMDDGTYPAGPRNDNNHSRYKVEPGHNQSVVDMLRTTP